MGRPPAPHPRLRPRAALTVAPAVAATLAATLLGACTPDRGPSVSGSVVARIPIEPTPGALAAGEGAVWVLASTASRPTRYRHTRHLVARIDPRTNRVTATAGLPFQMTDLATGAGAVWIVGSQQREETGEPRGTLLRADPATGAVDRVVDLGLGAPSGVAVGFGKVWITDSRQDALIPVDPTTLKAAAPIAIAGGPTAVDVDARSVWVTSPGTGFVHRVDPRTGVPETRVSTGSLPSVVAAGPHGVWVSNYADEDLARVDPGGRRVERSVRFRTSASRLSDDGDRLAVVETEGRRLSVIASPGASPEVVLSGPLLVDVALDGDTAWVVDHARNRVLRVALRFGH